MTPSSSLITASLTACRASAPLFRDAVRVPVSQRRRPLRTIRAGDTRFRLATSQADDWNRPNFERWLALYRSRVQELHHSNDQPDSRANLKSWPPKEPVKPTVLVIEDNPDEWFFMRWALLQKADMADTIWLPRPQEVLPYLETCQQNEQNLPSLLLTDLFMPTLSEGLNMIQALKSHPVYQAIPLVTLSRSTDAAHIAQTYALGSNAYLIKPADYLQWREAFKSLETYLNR